MAQVTGTEVMVGVRKSAAKLSLQERDQFLEAVLRLKHRPVPNGPAGFSLYDQFVALHGAVMAVRMPGASTTTNFGHWNPGFCPWHREYLLRFERALQGEVPGVTLPYWDWSEHLDAQRSVFTSDFLGPLMNGSPSPMPSGVLGHDGPLPKPAWWPAGAKGFRIHPRLQEIEAASPTVRATLHRGSVGESWPPSRNELEQLTSVDRRVRKTHHFWFFWAMLEQGLDSVRRTHNAGHRFIGGHMGGAFSPNDPVFWLHHANVDRLWARWQATMLAAHPGTTHAHHYPSREDRNPFGGDLLPAGHHQDDLMWPWVGDASGYAPADAAYLPLLTGMEQRPARRVREVFDIDALGYSYEP